MIPIGFFQSDKTARPFCRFYVSIVLFVFFFFIFIIKHCTLVQVHFVAIESSLVAKSCVNYYFIYIASTGFLLNLLQSLGPRTGIAAR